MPPPIVLKRVTTNELPELRALGRSTYYEAFAQDNTAEDMQIYLDEAFSVARLTRELANPNSIFYFAQIDGVTAGYCKLNFGPAQTESIEDAIELERIYVAPGFQGRESIHP